MFPSPSEGPPWLSESASPAFGPCGMPFELEPEDDVDDWLEVVAGVEDAAGAELDVVLDELPEFDPQAATPNAASTSRIAVQCRGDRVLIACIMCSCIGWLKRVVRYLP